MQGVGCFNIRLSAKRSDIPRAELAPIRKSRRKRGPGFTGAQLQKSMPRTTRGSLPQPSRKIEIKKRRAIFFNE